MRILLGLVFLLMSCANHGKLERIKAENPNCEVDNDYNVTCPSPFVEEDIKGANFQKLSKSEVAELTAMPEQKKVKQSCKMRERASMDSKPVGFVPRGKTVEVTKVSTDWYSYYDAHHGVLVYLGIKCFTDSPRKVKDGKGKMPDVRSDREALPAMQSRNEYYGS